MATARVNQKAQSKGHISIARPSSIFAEMDQLMRRVEERAFNLFQQRGGGDGLALGDWVRAEHELLETMPIQVKETDHEGIVHAEIPGFEAKELSIRAEPDCIWVHGKAEKKSESKKGAKECYSEISTNEVYRTISLPTPVNPDKAHAHLEKGVLEIRLEKATPPKRVEIKAS